MDSLTARVTPLLTSLIYNQQLTATLFRSYLRLYAAAWKQDYRTTAALDFESQLVQLLGLSSSQARRHLQQLRISGLLNWQIDADQRYVICFTALDDSQSALKRDSAFPDPDDVVNSINLINIKDSKHHHTQVQSAIKRVSALAAAPAASSTALTKTAKQEAEDRPLDEAQRFVLSCLARAGIWSDVAQRLAEQIYANHCAADPYQPGVADVLGWIVYCCGEQEKNSIHTPAAVLARNLQSGRCCPEALRPQPICARCGYEHSACVCEEGPQDYFPPEFIDAAFKGRHYDINTNRWGVCKICHAFPCKC